MRRIEALQPNRDSVPQTGAGFRRLLAIAWLAAALALALPSRLPAIEAASAPPPEVTVLGNGLTIASRTRSSAETVTVAVGVRTGGRDEDDSLRGGSHWLEHIHFLGTARYPTPEAVFRAITSIGGEMNAFTGPETTVYWATVPAPRFDVALDVMAELMQQATFPSDEVERERGVVQEELRGLSPSPLTRALFALGERLIGPVGRDSGGSVEAVAGIALPDLMRYRAQRYVARNMVVAVVGPLSHADVVLAARPAFAGLPSGAPAAVAPLPPLEEDLRLEAGAGVMASTAATVVVGQRVPGENSPDAAALVVLDAILDVPGTRMIDAFDESDLPVRNAGTRLVLFSDTGLWAAFAVLPGRNDARGEVAEVVREEIRRLQVELVSEDELHAATRQLAGRTLIGAELTNDQAIRLADQTVLGTYETEESWAARLADVTAEDVRRVARTYFNPDTLSILVQR